MSEMSVADAEFAAAAEMWNAMSQEERHALLVMAIRISELVQGDDVP